MKFNQIINEMKQYNKIARIKIGKLTYIIKMTKEVLTIKDYGDKIKDVDVVIPTVPISIFSAHKRQFKKDTLYKDTGNTIKNKVRKTVNTLYDKSYAQLSQDEIKEFNTSEALSKILIVFADYFKEFKPEYVMFTSYKDNKNKRDKFYDLVLKKNGYSKANEYGNWVLYSKKNKVKEILKKQAKPSLKNTIKDLASNI